MRGRGLRGRLGHAAAAFTSNWRNPNLRRAQLSFLGAWTAEWAFTVALGVVAYEDGGALAVGLVGLLRMVPSAVLAPFLSPFADRGRRERVLVVVSMLRGAATAVAAVTVTMSGPVIVVYALAVLSTIAATLFRPAHSALLPTLCHTGHELASANVVRGMLDSIATLVGPLLAAVLLAVTDVSMVFAVAAASSFWAGLLLLRVRYEAPPHPASRRSPALMKEAVEGVRTVTRDGDLLVILGLAAAQSLTRGALTVFSVVVAIELIDTGDAGVGALMAAVGVGAVVGSLGASFLVETGRLGVWFAAGVGLWGLPIALIGVFPQQGAALGLLALVGVGNALVDVAGFTLIGRLAPDEVMARVFGLLESLVAVSIGLGALLASSLVEWFGVREALVSIGLICPVLAVAALRRMRRLDRFVDELELEIELLQQVPMLHPLPLPAVEQLARSLELVTVLAGQPAVTEGEIADHYYVIESGEAEVVGDGQVVATLGAGEGFGEIALLRHTRRTATVVATSTLELRALRSDRFLSAVLGYTQSARVAEAELHGQLDLDAPEQSPDEPPESS